MRRSNVNLIKDKMKKKGDSIYIVKDNDIDWDDDFFICLIQVCIVYNK